jgi:RNA polymerase sigma factor (sigma-70 family)
MITAEFFSDQYREYAPRTFKFFRRRFRFGLMAEDLNQETWTRAWARREQYRGDSAFYTWVVSIARFLLLDYWRRRRALKRNGFMVSIREEDAHYQPQFLKEIECQQILSRCRPADRQRLIEHYIYGEKLTKTLQEERRRVRKIAA